MTTRGVGFDGFGDPDAQGDEEADDEVDAGEPNAPPMDSDTPEGDDNMVAAGDDSFAQLALKVDQGSSYNSDDNEGLLCFACPDGDRSQPQSCPAKSEVRVLGGARGHLISKGMRKQPESLFGVGYRETLDRPGTGGDRV